MRIIIGPDSESEHGRVMTALGEMIAQLPPDLCPQAFDGAHGILIQMPLHHEENFRLTVKRW